MKNEKDKKEEYKEYVKDIMHDISTKSFENSGDCNEYYRRVGENLPYDLTQRYNITSFQRDYKNECVELKKYYTALTEYATKTRNSIPKEIFESEYNFFYSLDIFLESLLTMTDTKILTLVNETKKERHISDIVIAHDCIECTYNIITNEFVSITGECNQEPILN